MEETKKTATQETTASEPERTFTQAELDAIIGDRLNRERAKYADYDTLKEKAGKFDAAEEANKTELQKATDKATELEKKYNALLAENTAREMREKVAKEMNVPANLLNGATEDECKAQAKAILEFAKPGGYPAVRDKGEVHKGDGSQFGVWGSVIEQMKSK